ncbi:hypothetical protein DQ569_24475, partial [Salmonella enterica]|nr:hypothetical protein [Salmonella enterica]
KQKPSAIYMGFTLNGFREIWIPEKKNYLFMDIFAISQIFQLLDLVLPATINKQLCGLENGMSN